MKLGDIYSSYMNGTKGFYLFQNFEKDRNFNLMCIYSDRSKWSSEGLMAYRVGIPVSF